MTYAVELPYPPSTNVLHRAVVIKGRGRTLESKELRVYKARVSLMLLRYKPLDGPVAVTLRVYRPRKAGDLDNRAKAVLDAVKGRLFVDDSQVVELHMYRYDDKANPRVEVTVAPVAATVAP